MGDDRRSGASIAIGNPNGQPVQRFDCFSPGAAVTLEWISDLPGPRIFADGMMNAMAITFTGRVARRAGRWA